MEFDDKLSRLAELSAEELDALEQEMVAAFDAADAEGNVELMQTLADGLDAVRAAKASSAEAAPTEEPAVAAASAESESEPKNEDDGGRRDDDDNNDADADDEPDTDAPDETETETPEDSQPDEEEAVEVTDKDVPEDNQPVAASGPSYVIRAGGDIPGLTAGSQLDDMDAVVEAMTKKINTLRGIGNGEYVVVASFNRDEGEIDEDKMLRAGDSDGNSRKIRKFMKENDSVEALTAAGWCAPRTPLYDIPGIGVTDTPVKDSLPSFGVDRGGIIWQEPASLGDLSTLANGTLFSRWVFDETGGEWGSVDMTGAPISGDATIKPCVEIDCGNERQADLEAVPFCLCFDNLTSRANPEWVRHTTDLVMVAQARWTEQLLMYRMWSSPGVQNHGAGAGTIGEPDVAFGATRDWLITARLAASQFRWRNRLGANFGLRIYAPAWLRDAVAADLMLQIPGDDTMSTSYAEVDGFLSDINLDPIWYIDDNPANTAAEADVTAASNFDSYLGWGQKAEWLIAVPGAFVVLDGGSLDLGVVRTKEDLQKNKYCQFAETFESLAYMGPTDPAQAWAVRGTTTVTVRGGFAPAVATVPAGGVVGEA